MSEILSNLSELIKTNLYLAPVLALLAGVLASFMPCCLSNIPLVMGYISSTGEETTTKKSFLYALTFVIGNAITFVSLGIFATFAGMLMGFGSNVTYFILGTIMVLMALQTWEIYEIVPSANLLSKNTKRGFLGAIILGILAGIFSSPCSTPVLIALLAMVAEKGSFLYGIVLMLLYSLGHGVLTLIAGTSVGLVRKIKKHKKYHKVVEIIRFVMGLAILLMGYYLFWLAF